jgi:hypothetical protein
MRNDPLRRSPRAATASAAAVVALAACVSIGAFGGGAPSVTAPTSILLVLPFLFGVPLPLVIAIVVAAFAAWSFPLFRGSPKIPLRTILLLLVAVACSAVWYVLGWGYGVKYEGLRYTVSCLSLNCAFALMSALLTWRARTAPSYGLSLSVHTLLFIWLVTYAFPYLGETP